MTPHQPGPAEIAASDYDPAIARLPHPYRLMAAMGHIAETSGYKLGADDYHVLAFGRVAYDDLIRMLATESMNQPVIERMCAKHPSFRAFVGVSSGLPGVTEQGQIYWLLDYLRWRFQGKHFFQTTMGLEAGLQNTDIAEGIPAAMVRPPYPIQYIQCGDAVSSPYHLINPASGAHVFEGAYVLTGVVPPGYPESGLRFIEFVFTGTAYGKKDNLDDATAAITLTVHDENATMLEVLEEALNDDDARGLKREAAEATDIRQCLFHLCKILLYLNTEKVVKTPLNERSELQVRLARVGAGKRGKLERQLTRTYDRIVIGAKTPPLSGGGGPAIDSGRHLPTFWRRGHFRNQPYGEGRQQHRIIWIEPVLVNADVAVSAPQSKPYVIKGPGE